MRRRGESENVLAKNQNALKSIASALQQTESVQCIASVVRIILSRFPTSSSSHDSCYLQSIVRTVSQRIKDLERIRISLHLDVQEKNEGNIV